MLTLIKEVLSPAQQLLLLSLARDRFFQALDKVWVLLVILGTSLEDRAARRSYVALLLQLNLLFSPLLLVLVVTSSLISAPLLPLFTLPVFFISFPRPSRCCLGPDSMVTPSTGSGPGR